jgi:hypothetical protein
MQSNDVDWSAVLATDPRVRVDSEESASGGRVHVSITLDEPVAVRTPGGQMTLVEASGTAMTENTQTGQLDADRDNVTILPLRARDGSGVNGVLVYRLETSKPRLLGALAGYDLRARLHAGMLVVRQPVYVGFESAGQPSAMRETAHVVYDDRLIPVRVMVHALIRGERETVAGYYAALADRRFADAYAFLSPRFQAEDARFSDWVAGFDATDEVILNSAEPTPGAVSVDVTAVERWPDGTRGERSFAGNWFLIWSPAAGRWLLDRAQIAERRAPPAA